MPDPSSRSRAVDCSRTCTVTSSQRPSMRTRCRSAPTSRACCAGCAVAPNKHKRAAAIGEVLSMVCGHSFPIFGDSFPRLNGAGSCAMPGRGGISTATGWRRRSQSGLTTALAEGQLNIIAGKITSLVADGKESTVHYRRRGTEQIETMQVTAILDCTGISSSPRRSPNPLVRDLLSRGMTRPDPLELGLDVTECCALIDQSGRASQRLFAVGPITRGRFWEIMAVPDIRVQCDLATAIIASDQPIAKEQRLMMAV